MPNRFLRGLRDFYKKHPAVVPFSLVWWGIFLLLFCVGITGSSLGWYKQYPGTQGIMELQGERKLFGVYRGIRGDEFIAHGTPNAIAQFYAHPQFPQINRNLGITGRNLLLLHDSGAPVKHPAILGRPTTWGFWTGDLRRALSWHWLFPIFFAGWSMFLLCRALWEKVHFGWHIFLSLAAIAAPYPAAWSFWPAGYAGGLLLATALTVALLRRKISAQAALPTGIIAGWGTAVSAMYLYFPGIWPIALLMLFVTAGTAWQERKFLPQLKTPLLWFLPGLLLTGGLLLCCWYLAVQDVIPLVANAVYPGLRRNPGGEMEWWMAMRGFLAPLTIYKLDFSNQSEMQNAQLLFLPLIILMFRVQELRRDRIFLLTSIFLSVILFYQYIGFPGWLATATGFDRCTGTRCGMALHLAQLLLFGAMLRYPERVILPRWQAVIATGVITVSGGLLLFTAPAELWQGLRPWHPAWRLAVILAGITLAHAGVCYALFRRWKTGILFWGVTNIIPALLFNPVCLAPVSVQNRLPGHCKTSPTTIGRGRILFATGNDFLAVTAYLAGNRVLNGYFMYMDSGIQEKLLANTPHPEQFHRMNHLDAALERMDHTDFRAEVTHPERIKLTFDPVKYDFRKLPADFLGAPEDQRDLLQKNRSVKLISSADRIDYWQICHPQD